MIPSDIYLADDKALGLLQSNVEDGAIWLDRVRPGWADKVNDTMDMRHEMIREDGDGGDVLNQVTGLQAPYAVRSLMDEEMVVTGMLSKLGFQISDIAYDALLATVSAYADHDEDNEEVSASWLGWATLTVLWKGEVMEREEVPHAGRL